jgi:AcrR family transcriptional regulator
MLSAAVELIAERGYRPVSVADIVKRAAIARAKFYANFSSKEDCFFVAYDRAVAEALRLVAEACEKSPGPFPERLRAGLAALLAYLAADPALARACVVEASSVGPAGEERRDRALRDFADLVRAARGQAGEAEPRDDLEESVLGGLYWLLYHAILGGEPKRLEDLLPGLTEFALISLVGPDGAREAAGAPPPPSG